MLFDLFVEYDTLIEDFQETMYESMNKVFKYNRIEKSDMEYNIRWDEAVVILYSDTLMKNIYTALMLAFYMKSIWFQSSFNIERISEAKIPSDIGIGIHTGKVIVRNRVSQDGNPKAEGYAINLAKRIEGLSRRGTHLKIMLSSDAKTLLQQFDIDVELSAQITEHFKGILSPVIVYEVIDYSFHIFP